MTFWNKKDACSMPAASGCKGVTEIKRKNVFMKGSHLCR